MSSSFSSASRILEGDSRSGKAADRQNSTALVLRAPPPAICVRELLRQQDFRNSKAVQNVIKVGAYCPLPSEWWLYRTIRLAFVAIGEVVRDFVACSLMIYVIDLSCMARVYVPFTSINRPFPHTLYKMFMPKRDTCIPPQQLLSEDFLISTNETLLKQSLLIIVIKLIRKRFITS
jgi:hypothetical protein